MILKNIAREFPHHTSTCKHSDNSLFLADYSEQTNSKHGVTISEGTPPDGIGYFTLTNDVKLRSCCISFNNKSFVGPDGSPLSHCECVVFPKSSTPESWMFFVELKYGAQKRNRDNVTKAIKQLYKTRTYYKLKGVFESSNTCYLLVSLPTQSEPFVQSIVAPNDAVRLKRRHNVVLRLQNSATVRDDKIINVS